MTQQGGSNEATMGAMRFAAWAEAFVSEQVLDGTAQAIVTHLDGCPGCHVEVAGLARLRASVRAAYLSLSDTAPNPEFVTKLGSRLRAEAIRGKRMTSWGRTWFAIAATFLLIVSGGFGLRGRGVSGFTAILQAAVGDHALPTNGCSEACPARPRRATGRF